MIGRATTLLIAGCLLLGCNSQDQTESRRRTIVALGTLITVEIDGIEEPRAERALQKLEDYFLRIQRDWYAFGDGELGRINGALSSGSKSADISTDLADLTRRSLALRELSEGLFDPTIGLLIELWGFGDAENTPVAPPDVLAIQQWQDHNETPAVLRLDDRTISADRPVKLTFGAIAKGTALNDAMALLEEMGVANALVTAGGDLKVLGRRGDRPWRIGIRDPHSDGILGTVELAPGEAIVTSGDYERFFRHQGRHYHHLLDPRTGRPVTHTAGVTVIHPNAELADAAATALMVAGAQRFDRIAEPHGN